MFVDRRMRVTVVKWRYAAMSSTAVAPRAALVRDNAEGVTARQVTCLLRKGASAAYAPDAVR